MYVIYPHPLLHYFQSIHALLQVRITHVNALFKDMDQAAVKALYFTDIIFCGFPHER